MIQLAYNNESIELNTQLKELIPNLISFNEDIPKERKKAFSIKNKGGTRVSPFLVITYGDVPIKAFWTEDNTCNFKFIL